MTTSNVNTFVGTLREALNKKDWYADYAHKSLQFREKFAQSGVQRTKGAGGTVSALRRTQTRCRRMADILKAAVSSAGHALVHGSIALTVDLEANKNMLNQLHQKHKWNMYNVQHHPWVNMDHNNSVDAYYSWQDTRHSRLIENQMKKELDGKPPLTNKEVQNMKQLVRMRLRARLRRDALTTLCIDMSNDKESACVRYGTDYIVLRDRKSVV